MPKMTDDQCGGRGYFFSSSKRDGLEETLMFMHFLPQITGEYEQLGSRGRRCVGGILPKSRWPAHFLWWIRPQKRGKSMLMISDQRLQIKPKLESVHTPATSVVVTSAQVLFLLFVSIDF